MALQARTEFASALNQVSAERGIEPEIILDSIKQAILAAYRKDYGEPEGIDVALDANTGEVKLTKKKKDVTPAGFGRIAAQTAKQVILQRIREAEKNAILSEYLAKVGSVISGIIQRISGPIITVNLGKAEGIMPPPEQSRNEKYAINQRLKFYIVGIKEGARGEEIIVSRSAPQLLEGLFKQEVPELASASVEVRAIAREGGSRSKIAVASKQPGVDPVGSCVGQKGVRVQAVMNELADEKIDIIAYQEKPEEFIKAALSPAKDLQVEIAEAQKTAQVTVPDDQLSLAIGKGGQNVRLAAKLTGYKINIRGKSGTPKEVEAKEKKARQEAKKALGVKEEEAQPKADRPLDEKVSKAKEKGTAEKSSAKGDQKTPADDQSVKQADDQTVPTSDQNKKTITEDTEKELEGTESVQPATTSVPSGSSVPSVIKNESKADQPQNEATVSESKNETSANDADGDESA